MAGDDVVSRIMREIRATARSDGDLVRVEIDIRSEMGGERFYLQKAPVNRKVQSIAANLAAGMTLQEAFEAAGVSSTTGYRLIRRR